MKRDKNGLAVPRPYKLGNSRKSIVKFLDLIQRVPGCYLVEGPDGTKAYFMTPHEYYRFKAFEQATTALLKELEEKHAKLSAESGSHDPTIGVEVSGDA
jgi:hypothetical protein